MVISFKFSKNIEFQEKSKTELSKPTTKTNQSPTKAASSKDRDPRLKLSTSAVDSNDKMVTQKTAVVHAEEACC